MATIIERGDGYTIASFGNGAAYSITRERDGKKVFVQYGDDAAAFRASYDALDECSPGLRPQLLQMICGELVDLAD